MNLNYPDPEENPIPSDDNDSGWTSIPSDEHDYIVKGDTEPKGMCLDED
ncbi:hypothetical protein [Pedobacter mendelii]|uniref:Uncharacterized protein n=1 Tax=Pedobacter mendelii TaxID=1908240 RepID=A0ABQ2BDK5_9SPHI|nr:hypothetical protein [Pedobacter mendelii]GGI23633.1 hypothetical protein GCM10008119_08620 [Pedobacter mendelii]